MNSFLRGARRKTHDARARDAGWKIQPSADPLSPMEAALSVHACKKPPRRAVEERASAEFILTGPGARGRSHRNRIHLSASAQYVEFINLKL